MKYYIRAINTETGKSMIMSTPVFTNRKSAESFIEKMTSALTPVARLEVIKRK